MPANTAALAGLTASRLSSRPCGASAAAIACCSSMVATAGKGALTANRTRGQDMVDCLKLLQPDAMTGHWEFTYGETRLRELIDRLGTTFLALNIRDTEWQEPVFDGYKMFEEGQRAGCRVGRQAV